MDRHPRQRGRNGPRTPVGGWPPAASVGAPSPARSHPWRWRHVPGASGAAAATAVGGTAVAMAAAVGAACGERVGWRRATAGSAGGGGGTGTRARTAGDGARRRARATPGELPLGQPWRGGHGASAVARHHPSPHGMPRVTSGCATGAQEGHPSVVGGSSYDDASGGAVVGTDESSAAFTALAGLSVVARRAATASRPAVDDTVARPVPTLSH